MAKRLRSSAVLGTGMVVPFALVLPDILARRSIWKILVLDDGLRLAVRIGRPLAQAPRLFWWRICHLAAADLFLWLISATGLVLIWFDGRLRHTRLWLLGCVLSAALTSVPGFYFRKHYFLLMLPAVALLAGAPSAEPAVFGAQVKSIPLGDWPVWGCALVVTATIVVRSHMWFAEPMTQIARRIYGADPFPESEIIAALHP